MNFFKSIFQMTRLEEHLLIKNAIKCEQEQTLFIDLRQDIAKKKENYIDFIALN